MLGGGGGTIVGGSQGMLTVISSSAARVHKRKCQGLSIMKGHLKIMYLTCGFCYLISCMPSKEDELKNPHIHHPFCRCFCPLFSLCVVEIKPGHYLQCGLQTPLVGLPGLLLSGKIAHQQPSFPSLIKSGVGEKC